MKQRIEDVVFFQLSQQSSRNISHSVGVVPFSGITYMYFGRPIFTQYNDLFASNLRILEQDGHYMMRELSNQLSFSTLLPTKAIPLTEALMAVKINNLDSINVDSITRKKRIGLPDILKVQGLMLQYPELFGLDESVRTCSVGTGKVKEKSQDLYTVNK